MNKILYRIASIILILAGIFWAGINFYGNVYLELNSEYISYLEVIFGGIIGSIGILLLFILPSLYYLKLKKYDNYTNTSVILTLIGILIVLIAFIIMMIMCPPSTYACDGFGLIIVSIGLVPGAILYVISLILILFVLFLKPKSKN